jgi:hypothetical protein
VAHPLFQVGAGYAASILIRNDFYIWLIVTAAFVVLLNLLVTIPWWMNPWRVRILLRMIREVVGARPEEDVRCALFRPTLFGKSLIEVLMATEDGEHRRTHRVWMKVSQGVAGRAYRTSQICYIPITGDWQNHLMTDFGFTSKELSRFRSDRKSYLCVPILGEHGKVRAILSFDSKYADTFTSDRILQIESLAPYFSAAISGE